MQLELKEQRERCFIQYEEMEVVEELGNARDFVEGFSIGLAIGTAIGGAIVLT